MDNVEKDELPYEWADMSENKIIKSGGVLISVPEKDNIMKQKYYTPTIDEFYVGFEFEGHVTLVDGHGWSEAEINSINDFKHFESNYDELRVKYLDQKDIESLGFEKGVPDRICEYGNLEYFGCIVEDRCLRIYINFKQHRIWIRQCLSDGEFLFKGTIKNKSELKKILSWVGYMF